MAARERMDRKEMKLNAKTAAQNEVAFPLAAVA
jgi:hypothetical protein